MGKEIPGIYAVQNGMGNAESVFKYTVGAGNSEEWAVSSGIGIHSSGRDSRDIFCKQWDKEYRECTQTTQWGPGVQRNGL